MLPRSASFCLAADIVTNTTAAATTTSITTTDNIDSTVRTMENNNSNNRNNITTTTDITTNTTITNNNINSLVSKQQSPSHLQHPSLHQVHPHHHHHHHYRHNNQNHHHKQNILHSQHLPPHHHHHHHPHHQQQQQDNKKHIHHQHHHHKNQPQQQQQCPRRQKWMVRALLVLMTTMVTNSLPVLARSSSFTNGFYRRHYYNAIEHHHSDAVEGNSINSIDSVGSHIKSVQPHQLKSKDKVQFLGAVLKRHISDLRQTKNKQVELVFLVDNSGSVGHHNFFNEIKFVRKLLADFTVDQNTTRVAVVTFSSKTKIIKNVDFLTDPTADNHKCSLLEDYLPRIRYLGGGTFTLGAFRIANESHGDSPQYILNIVTPHACRTDFLGPLQNSSGRLSCFVSLIHVHRLRNSSVFFKLAFSSRDPCPSGTYKNTSTPGDVLTCTKCPDENHVTNEGATLTDDCKCKRGFRKFADNRCASLKCPRLAAPKSGYFVNNKCSNDFNAACGTRCEPGYYLKGDSVRICQEDGEWSGNASECRMKVCPHLPTPKNGNRICSRGDFTFSTVCRFTCDTGYKLIGSRRRTCLAIAYWSGITTRCREITCQHLNGLQFGTVSPDVCTGGDEVPFGTTCKLSCNHGFTLIGSPTKQCTPDGVWSPIETEVSRCIDTSPPQIFCPDNIDVEADENSHMTNVTWVLPLAYDNSGLVPSITTIPAVQPPARFPIGVTLVTYIAQDANKNRQECKFNVTVKDTQPPRVDRCPRSVTVVSEKPEVIVTWEEPLFSDNSNGKLHITKSHDPSSSFQQGITDVIYRAYDDSKNVNNCTIQIHVLEHRCTIPLGPRNGMRDCHRGEAGVHCTLTCMEGYAFALTPAEEYFCSFEDYEWTPKSHLPFPDCSVEQVSNDVIQPARLTFLGNVLCDEARTLNRIEDNFKHRVTQLVNGMCTDNMECEVENVARTCEDARLEDFNKIQLSASRTKRSPDWSEAHQHQFPVSVRVKRHSTNKLSRIMFHLNIEGKISEDVNITNNISMWNDEVKMNMKMILDQLSVDVRNISADLGLSYTNMSYDLNSATFCCKAGSVLVNGRCVLCPVGTFFNVVSKKCQSCQQGTYQQQEGMVTCNVCPEKTSTLSDHSKTVKECQAQCLPGSFSHDGLEFCETCPLGHYQSEYAQKSCLLCQNGTSTLSRGSRLQEDCKDLCKAGHVSETGLEPCMPCPIGSYQSEMGKNACYLCPNKSPTPNAASTRIQDCAGKKCEFGTNACLSTPCRNGGICENTLSGFKCSCFSGFEGDTCEKNTDECANDTCLNGGTCRDLLDDYKCQCRSGFTGINCEINVDLCHAAPCQNNATCFDEEDDDGYRCQCVPGFTGKKCEQELNECESNPCKNAGSCEDKINGFVCHCHSQYTGLSCETEVDGSYSLQFDGPSTMSYTAVKMQRPLSAFTLTFWMKTKDTTNYGTVVSYATPLEQNALTVIDYNEFTLYINGKSETTDVVANDGLWHHIAVTWSMVDGSWEIYLDSKIINQAKNLSKAQQIEGNGLLVVGQEQDSMGGGFNSRESFIGELGQINLWDYKLDPAKFKAMLTSCDEFGNVVSWPSFQSGLRGRVKSLSNTFCSDCKQPQKVDQGSVQVAGNTTGSNALYSCNIGYNLKGENERVCLGTGDWSGANPKCEKIVCDRPKMPTNGRVSGTRHTFDNRVRYSCNHGYQLVGSNMSYCNLNGLWSNPPPKCLEIVCDAPVVSKHTHVSSTKKVYKPRDQISFFCSKGYRILTGHSSITCQLDGSWDKSIPSCDETYCSNIPEIQNAQLELKVKTRYFVGDNLKYKCGFGYRLANTSSSFSTLGSVRCMPGGKWQTNLTSCVIIDCGKPPDVEHAVAKYNKTEYLQLVRYVCEPGYELLPPEFLECWEEGVWSSKTPKCLPVVCQSPERVDKAEILVSNYTYGSTLLYKCKTHFTLIGNRERKCLENATWSGVSPICKPIHCPKPKPTEHGYAMSGDYKFGSIAVYQCYEGFEILTTPEVLCGSNGTWLSEPPKCQAISCLDPPTIENGFYNKSSRDYKVNDVVEYFCDEGYVLAGSDGIRCSSNKSWIQEIPVCVPINCSEPEDIENGVTQVEGVEFGNIVEYKCVTNYKLVGEAQRKCLSNETWEGEVPYCKPLSCSEPPEVANTSISFSTDLRVGSTVTYNCDSGYHHRGDQMRICLSDLTWSAANVTCEPVFCKIPPNIEHGYRNFTSRTYQSVVNYECNSGFKLTGSSQQVCTENATWSDKEPTCKAILCDSPSHFISNGRMHGVNFSYGAVVNYSCDSGYLSSDKMNRSCQANGEWDTPVPVCEKVKCPVLSVKRGRVSSFRRDYGASVSINCFVGYSLVGASYRTCLTNGSWSGGNKPFCAKNCGFLPRIANGAVRIKSKFGQNATYSCISTYELVGNANRTCLQNGQWSGKAPVCVRKRCPPVKSISYASVSKVSSGSKVYAQYRCKPGYEMIGNSTLQCISNSWVPANPPKCVKLRCPELRKLEHGKLLTVERSVGTRVQFECDEGYKMKKRSSMFCTASLTWKGYMPVCEAIGCLLPASIPNGFINEQSISIQELVLQTKKTTKTAKSTDSSAAYEVNDAITYSCESDYRIVGTSTRTCLPGFVWSGEEPKCEQIMCNKINIVNGYIFKTYERYPGAKLVYNCDRDYRARASSTTLICSKEGKWTGEEPICEQKTCKNITAPLHGRFSSNKRSIGAKLELICDEGFEPHPNVYIFCLPTEKWTTDQVKCSRVSCKRVASIANGFIVGKNYSYNSSIKYECSFGYRLVGNAERLCLANKQWSGTDPKCEKISCKDPPTIANAFYTHIKRSEIESTDSLEDVRYYCVEGYELIGDPIATCNEEGLWDVNNITCMLITCPEIKTLQHGSISNNGRQHYVPYTQLTFSCDVGYILIGHSTLLCLFNGSWDGTLPKCDKIVCPLPEEFPNGFVKFPPELSYGQSITYTCSENYILEGSAVRMCQSNGEWTNSAPECVLNICPEPKKPENGIVKYKSITVGSDAFYYCEEGYNLIGPPTITCLGSKLWSSETPICKEIQCQVPSVKNGRAVVKKIKDRPDRAEYKCDTGYQLEIELSYSQVCIKGKWSGLDPNCIPIECPEPPQVKNGFNNGSYFIVNDIVQYTCDDGHRMIGQSTLVCSVNGTYIGKVPECRPSMCGPPPVIQYATTLTTTYNDKMVITCNDGYYLKGNATAWCLSNRTWSPLKGECVPIDCGKPPQISQTESIDLPNGTVYGGFAEYKCEEGYALGAKKSLKCQSNGSWEAASSLECIPVDCGPPPTEDNVIYTGTAFTFTKHIFYNCEKGYTRKGPFISFCLMDAKWSNPSPQCKPVSCGDPPGQSNNELYIVKDGGTVYNSIIQYGCYGRLMVVGPAVVKCQADGLWNGTAPTCKHPPVANCGRPYVSDPMTVKLIANSYLQGSIAYYFCTSGLSPVKRPARLMCLPNGKWDGKAECRAHCKFSCLNGGKCIGLNRCKCPSGYAGVRCERAICIFACLNGGHCSSPYKCNCKPGFAGDRCERAHCARKCENGGRCIVGGICHCPNGFQPPFCSKRNTTIPIQKKHKKTFSYSLS
ncbi:sushi, von Willebrand factor type A, EGF and pentraxin domain-containing protein 1 [Octopus bimaculoides]|nr:sushi, von Willebrand factor type A, EGF and pentraxin domain-containing protein 1 [Octopus bimaculoides]